MFAMIPFPALRTLGASPMYICAYWQDVRSITQGALALRCAAYAGKAHKGPMYICA